MSVYCTAVKRGLIAGYVNIASAPRVHRDDGPASRPSLRFEQSCFGDSLCGWTLDGRSLKQPPFVDSIGAFVIVGDRSPRVITLFERCRVFGSVGDVA